MPWLVCKQVERVKRGTAAALVTTADSSRRVQRLATVVRI